MKYSQSFHANETGYKRIGFGDKLHFYFLLQCCDEAGIIGEMFVNALIDPLKMVLSPT